LDAYSGGFFFCKASKVRHVASRHYQEMAKKHVTPI
jgi:hypothetical protein